MENNKVSNVGEAHNVAVLGSGETTVVLGNSFGMDQSMWRHLVPHLVDKYRVLLYDDMGAHTTDPDRFDFERYSTIDGYANDLISILEEFKVEKCTFVGISLSAIAATIASISRPELFRKLIMISTSPRVTNVDDYYGGIEPEKMEQHMAAIEENRTAFYECFAPVMVGGPDRAVVEEFKRNILILRPEICLHGVRMINTLDLRAYLSQVTVPCHVIQSAKDMIVPVAVGEYICRSLGGKSVLEVLPTEGHLPPLSSPEVTIPVLLRHIREDIAGDK